MSPVRLNNTIPGVGVPQTGQPQRKPVGASKDFAGALQAQLARQGGV